jgi:hypothetical protein
VSTHHLAPYRAVYPALADVGVLFAYSKLHVEDSSSKISAQLRKLYRLPPDMAPWASSLSLIAEPLFETRLLESTFQLKSIETTLAKHKNNTPPSQPSSILSTFITAVMAVAQRFVISVLLILTVIFVLLAQSAEAGKGPKITNKVDAS